MNLLLNLEFFFKVANYISSPAQLTHQSFKINFLYVVFQEIRIKFSFEISISFGSVNIKWMLPMQPNGYSFHHHYFFARSQTCSYSLIRQMARIGRNKGKGERKENSPVLSLSFRGDTLNY